VAGAGWSGGGAVCTLANDVTGSRAGSGGQWRKWFAVLAVLVGLAVPSSAAAVQNVAIGDSITEQSRDEILNRFLISGWPGDVLATSGYRIDQLRPYIQVAAAGSPDLRRMFIFGGTNDAWQYHNRAWDLNASLLHLHAAVDDVTSRRPNACVFLATIHDLDLPVTERFHWAATVLNSEMREIARELPKVHMVPWNYNSQSHPEWFSDFIGHLTQDGQWALADHYRWYGTSKCG
jgi:hypothetical protein